VCAAIYGGIVFYQWYFPVSYNYFVAEDSWVEYGTFVLCFWAGLLVFASMKTDQSLRRLGYILFCLALMFVAMEEISWGQRLLGIKTPHIIAQHNYQSEISIHNISFFPSQFLISLAILIWAGVIPQLLRIRWANSLINQFGVPVVSLNILPYFIFGFIVKNFNLVIKHEELGELIFGLGFYIYALGLWRKASEKSQWKILQGKNVSKLITGMVFLLLILMIKISPFDIYALKRVLHNSAERDYPRYKMYNQSLKIYEYLRNHKELHNDDTLYKYGLFLKERNKEESEQIFAEAFQEAKTQMQQQPGKPYPNILAGKIYKQLNQAELSQKEFEKALTIDRERLSKAELDWEKVDALKSMGETYFEMGNIPLALENLQKALEYAHDGSAKMDIKHLINEVNIKKNRD
jgi:tetratricopeptide (TPR) repeat protein